MAPAVRVEAQWQAMFAKHLAQRAESRIRSFLIGQKRRIDRARRVIQRDDQIERRLAAKPFMPRAVLMQHHAWQGAGRTLAPMRAAPLGALQ